MVSNNKISTHRLTIVIFLTLASTLISAGCACQTWDEFFHQEDKQKEYDISQRTALSFGWVRTVYIQNAIKYGLETVNNVVAGNFNLSRDFFDHLKNVSPGITASARMIDIVMFQYYIARDMRNVYNFCSSSRNFTAAEIRYIEKVHSNFLVLTDANISELIRIVSPGELTMTDDERMQQIDGLYETMCDQQAFVQAFGGDVYQLSRERQKEASSLEYSRQLYLTY